MIADEGITEIVGPLSSGRSSVVVAWLRDVTRTGAVAAVVDMHGAFDPASAARAGVDLGRLLWVRCDGRRHVALQAADLLVRCPGFALVVLDVGETAPRLSLTAAFRLRLAARRAGTRLVILAERRVAGAGSSVALTTERRGLQWSGPPATPTRLARVGTAVTVVRARGARAAEDGGTVWWLRA
jgi:hypothetical protein